MISKSEALALYVQNECSYYISNANANMFAIRSSSYGVKCILNSAFTSIIMIENNLF